MARPTIWIALILALIALAGCAGPRAGSACAPACAPACDPCATQVACEPADRPAEAQSGQAWCRVWIPPVSRTVTERVLVCPARTETIRIPAEYGTRPKLTCVSPAQTREVIKPGVWTQTKEDVLVRPARSTYRRVDCPTSDLGPCEKAGDCWVKQDCPPVFKQACKAVCVEAPTRTLEYTPAKYELREERFLLSPARCETQCVPAKYEDRTRTECVSPGRWEWRRNESCEVPVEEGLPALEVEMVDSNPQGGEEGVFAQGSVVRYDLTVRSDVGSQAFPTIKVVFSLPPELEFISGGGQGVQVTGSGRSAYSSTFKLPLEQEVRMHILARVKGVPPTSYVQATASIQTEAGEELATETESTTLKPIE